MIATTNLLFSAPTKLKLCSLLLTGNIPNLFDLKRGHFHQIFKERTRPLKRGLLITHAFQKAGAEGRPFYFGRGECTRVSAAGRPPFPSLRGRARALPSVNRFCGRGDVALLSGKPRRRWALSAWPAHAAAAAPEDRREAPLLLRQRERREAAAPGQK